jgi:hypothetical protein
MSAVNNSDLAPHPAARDPVAPDSIFYTERVDLRVRQSS